MNAYHQFISHPLVSVIIPAYNAEAFLEKTLKSVLSQTYKNIEVLVVDDGSQDRTAEIVYSFAQQDRRVTLLQQPNSGVAAARNLAIQYAKGEFIAPIDADDIWYPHNLEKQVQCIMEADASVGLVYAWSVEIDEEDFISGGFHSYNYEGEVYGILVYRNFLGNASAALIRRSCIEKVGDYNCDLRLQEAQGCEDWDLYLRIAECYQVRVVPEFLIGYRQLTNSMSRNYQSMAKSQSLVLEAVQKRHPEIPAAVYQWSISNFYMYLAHQSSKDGNPSIALYWLYKAWQFDVSMTLIRHDLYVIIVKIINYILFQKIKKARIFKLFSLENKILKSSKKSGSKPFTQSDINRLIRIRNLLPSKLYEQARLKWLYLQRSYAIQ
ncbi:glycosyltransferase family 2 protein [Coleofasciculus sp.]|uniref:glycosyltransferase family 2 protein n=1 Tax=Coleofasciculus sp. TaxID=3100458 RepID=UPI0039FA7784